MKRRRVLIIAAAIFVAAVLTVVLWPQEKEPMYQGRKLSQWIQIGYASIRGTTNEAVAGFAIQQIGTNALPYLLKAMAYHRPGWKERLLQGLFQVGRMGPTRVTRYFAHRFTARDRRAEETEFGFRALGSAAAPAVPRLEELARHAKPVSDRALDALSHAGEVGAKALVRLLQDEGYAHRGPAASRVMGFCMDNRTNTGFAVPVLITCLGDTNGAVVRPAATALSHLRADPEICVPMLLALTRHTDPVVRAVAVFSLGQYGTNAQSCIPALIEATGDSDKWVRERATNALRRIASELQTNGVSHTNNY